MSLRRRFVATVSLAVVVAVSSALAGGSAFGGRQAAAAARDTSASSFCVAARPGCLSTIQAAVDAAHDGDTIRVGPGTFAGGVTIDVSIELIGAGPNSTIIDGGGPVLTIGVAGADSEPTVTVEGITVTGGHTVGNLLPWRGKGGGVYIPRAAGPATGATVTIRNSVIRGNTVAPAVSVDSGIPCPGGDCPFADASGGGISNDGNLTLDHTIVSDNLSDAASGLTSDAEGGGIITRAFGNLTLRNSIVTRNRAEATPPNGRFADGGGILMIGGTLTMENSAVTNNSAALASALPSDVDQLAIGGGVHVTENADATIRWSTISGNQLSAFNTIGDATAFSGGLHTDGPLVLSDSSVSGNHVRATTAPGSTGNANADSGAGELNADATIGNTRFSANSVTSTSADGAASATAGASVTGGPNLLRISDSVVGDNRVVASAPRGAATVDGGGLFNLGVLTLRTTRVTGNVGAARGRSGLATGGGLSNHGVPDGPPAVLLTVVDSMVSRNALVGGPGITLQGGGLFTAVPVTLTRSRVTHNTPDDCFGC